MMRSSSEKLSRVMIITLATVKFLDICFYITLSICYIFASLSLLLSANNIQVYWLPIDYLVVAKSAIVSIWFLTFLIQVYDLSICLICASITLCFSTFVLQSCGSCFTAVMYVEHWCEEHFNSLILGSPDFSHLEVVSKIYAI